MLAVVSADCIICQYARLVLRLLGVVAVVVAKTDGMATRGTSPNDNLFKINPNVALTIHKAAPIQSRNHDCQYWYSAPNRDNRIKAQCLGGRFLDTVPERQRVLDMVSLILQMQLLVSL
jgi:hypothetical protein